MSRQPDDVFGPDDDFRKGPVIDITPGREGKAGVDFESDVPIIEQVLSQGNKGPDRRDKRPSILDQVDKRTLAILAGAAVLIIILFLSLLSKLFSMIFKLF